MWQNVAVSLQIVIIRDFLGGIFCAEDNRGKKHKGTMDTWQKKEVLPHCKAICLQMKLPLNHDETFSLYVHLETKFLNGHGGSEVERSAYKRKVGDSPRFIPSFCQ